MTAKPKDSQALVERFQAWRQTYFPERQLFLRSEGRVRFLTIHSYTQMAIAASLLSASVWGAVTSYAYLTRDHVLENKNKTISTMSNQYKTLSNDFSALESEVERRAGLLEERQKFLEEMLGASVEEQADGVEASVETPAVTTDTAREAPEQQSSLLDQLFAESAAQAAVPNNTDRRVQLLEQLRSLEVRQQAVVATINNDLESQLVFIDSTLIDAGIASTDLLPNARNLREAIGGPYIPEQAFDGIFDASDGDTFVQMREQSERLKMITNALDSYPVGKPVEKYYISDRFGTRIDPFTKVRSKHYALDMAGWPGSAIEATAPGTVVYSGWYGPYGNMVEIDHGNGFRTRYGHMRKLSVKKNEQVELGQKLGEMGKTGRATGTHLHYEVWFNDKVRDPMPFMKAAANVLKIQGRYEETNE